METSIVKLSVTDKDSSHNGPPFAFTILAGNEGKEFVLDQEGVLRSAVIFTQKDTTEYHLHVQVSYYASIKAVPFQEQFGYESLGRMVSG